MGVALSILNRHEAETYRTSEPYAILGATDPDRPDASYLPSPLCRKILSLRFNDIGHQCCSKHRLFDDEHVRLIVEFAHWFRDSGVAQLIVHCEAGVSRSPAIALAMARFLRMDIGDVLKPFARYRPNTFIYWRLVRALLPGRELELIDELFQWTARSAAVVLATNGVGCSDILQSVVKEAPRS